MNSPFLWHLKRLVHRIAAKLVVTAMRKAVRSGQYPKQRFFRKPKVK